MWLRGVHEGFMLPLHQMELLIRLKLITLSITTLNSNATSTWIVKKLQSKLVADPDMSYSSMKDELLEKFRLELSNQMQLYRVRRKVKEEYERNYAESYNKLLAWAKLTRETNPRCIVKMEVEIRIHANLSSRGFLFDLML